MQESSSHCVTGVLLLHANVGRARRPLVRILATKVRDMPFRMRRHTQKLEPGDRICCVDGRICNNLLVSMRV
jgi:hypothetical protein